MVICNVERFLREDDLGLRISEQFRCANLAQVVVKYRIHPSQVSLIERRQQTLCKLAAQASALSRRMAHVHPLNAVNQITPAVLATMGVTEAMQRAHIFAERRLWIARMSKAGENRETLKSSAAALWWNPAARLRIADLHFLRLPGSIGKKSDSFAVCSPRGMR